jgi:predicted transcriptional regulator
MDKELIILEQIQNNPHVSQRDLASVAQASLGMTTAILKRFVAKGLITMKKVNNRNIHYILTAEGIDEVSKRSWGYFKRTIKNVVVYQDAINEIVVQAKEQGFEEVLLKGESDMAFIIEHVCHKHSIPFRQTGSDHLTPDNSVFELLAERQDFENQNDEGSNRFSLNRLILN